MTRAETSLGGTLLERRYRVEKLLARGGMSAVYRGLDTRLDRPVAIKIMDPRFAGDQSFIERFEREARSAARLHHPNVVAVHDQGVDTTEGASQEHAFLVMELVDGGTLRDVLRARGPLDIPLALSIAEPMLSALAAAHRAGLVHRDVKPENVLIGAGGPGGTGLVKVADFGLVRAVADTHTTSSSSVILGTVSYLSPERITSGTTSAGGDVYSAGIVLFEMLTGRVPYRGDNPMSIVYQHVNEDVPAASLLVPGIPPALDELVRAATNRSPVNRPSDAGQLLDSLQRVRAELGIAQAPIPALPAPDASDADPDKTQPALPAVPASAAPTGGPRGTRALTPNIAQRPAEPAPAAGYPAHEQSAMRQPDTKTGKRKKRRGGLIALITALVLLVAGGVGAGFWWFAGGRWVPVPEVTGMQQQKAEKTLRDAGLAPIFSMQRDNTAPSGTVISTDPNVGSDVLTGDNIAVTISTGKPTVPDITAGSSQEQAESTIRDAQLQPQRDVRADDFDANVPQGTVLRIEPNPGTPLNIDSSVRIILSKGPPPIHVPDVAGKNKDAAFAALRNAGLEPTPAGEEFSDSVEAGKVTRTDPAVGATIDGSAGKQIGVYVSNAVEVPSVLGKSLDEAKQILSEAGLQAEVDAGGHGGGFMRMVVGQDKVMGILAEKGSTIRLKTFP